MEKEISRQGDIITVFAKFSPRKGLEKKLRYYQQDAIEDAKKTLGNEKNGFWLEEVSGNSQTITNYAVPFENTWTFRIKFELDQNFVGMADEHFQNPPVKKKKSKETGV